MCSPRSKSFHLRVDPLLKEFNAKERKQEDTNMAENMSMEISSLIF